MRTLFIAVMLTGPFFANAQFTQSLMHGTAANSYTTFDGSKAGSGVSFSGGDNVAVVSSLGNSVLSVLGKSSGKWYCEITVNSSSTNNIVIIVAQAGINYNEFIGTSGSAPSYAAYQNASGGYIYCHILAGGDCNAGSYGTINVGDVIGVCLDMDHGYCYLINNSGTVMNGATLGSATGAMATGLSGTFYIGVGNYTSTSTYTANFGGSTFVHTVPAGYHAGIY